MSTSIDDDKPEEEERGERGSCEKGRVAHFFFVFFYPSLFSSPADTPTLFPDNGTVEGWCGLESMVARFLTGMFTGDER